MPVRSSAGTSQTPEVGEVIRRYGPAFIADRGDRLTPQHRKVLAALAACRTAEMGGRIHRCDVCQSETNLYNSCGDRHCPKCHRRDRAAWLEERCKDLLPVEYFHLVFTVPSGLNCLAMAHPAVFYHALMQSVKDTLLELAAAPNHLGALVGGLMVLHTWGQAMQLHPHVHVVVPGGGISLDQTHWVSSPSGFFLPVGVFFLGAAFFAFFLAAFLPAGALETFLAVEAFFLGDSSDCLETDGSVSVVLASSAGR